MGPARPSESSGEPRLGPREQRLAAVERRVLDDVIEKLGQCLTERGAGAVAELDQVGSVDGEIREAVRAAALGLDQAPEAAQALELALVARPVLALPDQIRLLVRKQVGRPAVAVPAEQPPRAP